MEEPRRNLLRWLLGGGSLLSFFYPAVKFMDPPDIPGASVNDAPAGKIQDLKPNNGKIAQFGSVPVLLVRTAETEWRAFVGRLHAPELHGAVSGGEQADLVRVPQRVV